MRIQGVSQRDGRKKGVDEMNEVENYIRRKRVVESVGDRTEEGGPRVAGGLGFGMRLLKVVIGGIGGQTTAASHALLLPCSRIVHPSSPRYNTNWFQELQLVLFHHHPEKTDWRGWHLPLSPFFASVNLRRWNGGEEWKTREANRRVLFLWIRERGRMRGTSPAPTLQPSPSLLSVGAVISSPTRRRCTMTTFYLLFDKDEGAIVIRNESRAQLGSNSYR